MKFLAKILMFGSTVLKALSRRLSGAHARNLAEKANLKKFLKEDSSRFGVFFDASEQGLYQLAMWLPVFEAVGESFFVVVARDSLVAPIRKLTKAPVVRITETSEIDGFAKLKNLKTWLYVNNNPKNSDFVRFPQFTHIQLMHGDSEKTASFNPVSGMFTKIFVAGQAGVDRYARNGVRVAADKFVKVGRPQGTEVKSISVAPKANQPATVLFSPTWGGSALGEEYSSLAIGEQIVAGLISRGATVIFRPHPFSARNPKDAAIIESIQAMLKADSETRNVSHIYGADAETKRTVAEVANLSTHMVSDISGIVSEWLLSLKPYLLVSMDLDAKSFASKYPVAKTGILLEGKKLEQLDKALDQLLAEDKKFDARKEMREYYVSGVTAKDRSALFKKSLLATFK